jgi:hypothetical protein
MGLPQLLACLDVQKRQGKEDNGEGDHDYILHGFSLLPAAQNWSLPALSRTRTILARARFKYRQDSLNKA